MTRRWLHSSALAVFVAFAAIAARPAVAQSLPRPEHPNPQMERAQWQNLNGTWEFWEGDECDAAAALARTEFPDRITVPFCRESKLSGLGRTGFVKNVVYRREFEVPVEWAIGAASGDEAGGASNAAGGRLLIHLGACDWRTLVWVNGKQVGFHEGGSAPIDCDVTDALKTGAGAKNELRVWAFDDTASRKQQCGKQCDRLDSYGCLYTRTTGIWQTVWMERVGATSIESFALTTDFGRFGVYLWDGLLDRTERAVGVSIRPQIRGATDATYLLAQVFRNGKQVADCFRPASGRGESLDFGIKEPRLWSPDDPALYDLVLSLRRSKPDEGFGSISNRGYVEPQDRWPVVIDEVHSYFAVRQIDIDGVAVRLNHKPLFQRTILDQGFYPDGIWTAPSDAALKRDIELSQAAGFNGARLHQKVFEPRFHYWADKLGYLTWGEAPSWGNDDGDPATHRVIAQEWLEIVARDRNHPSIVGWCPFNETGDGRSGPLQNLVTAETRAVDPTRLLLDTSGYVHSDPLRDVDDAHDYDQNPESFRARWWVGASSSELPARYVGAGGSGGRRLDRPFFVSEFGGIGWKRPDEPGWGYGDAPKTEAEWYARFQGLCDAQLENPTLFGFCYTQLTDVEQERNGLYRYDRTPKFDVAKLHAIVAKPAAIEQLGASAAAAATKPSPPDWKVVVPAAVDDRERTWSYVASDTPLPDSEWREWSLEKVGAKAGRPGFGKKDGYDVVIGTPWTSRELYLFRSFQFDEQPGAAIERALLVMHHDEAVTVCLNGQELFHATGWNDHYDAFDVTEKARALLRAGTNEMTIHVSQTSGGQYFDAALLVAPAASSGRPAATGGK